MITSKTIGIATIILHTSLIWRISLINQEISLTACLTWIFLITRETIAITAEIFCTNHIRRIRLLVSDLTCLTCWICTNSTMRYFRAVIYNTWKMISSGSVLTCAFWTEIFFTSPVMYLFTVHYRCRNTRITQWIIRITTFTFLASVWLRFTGLTERY